MKRGAVLLVGFLLGSCNMGFIYDEKLAGPYRLVAVDEMEQMVVCRSVGDEGDCSPDHLPGETIFAAGANDRFITLARHPREFPNQPNRAITEYYFVFRTSDEAERGVPAQNVRGPFSERQFQLEKRRLQLPEFGQVFDELK